MFPIDIPLASKVLTSLAQQKNINPHFSASEFASVVSVTSDHVVNSTEVVRSIEVRRESNIISRLNQHIIQLGRFRHANAGSVVFPDRRDEVCSIYWLR